jgi:hypothetical protein
VRAGGVSGMNWRVWSRNDSLDRNLLGEAKWVWLVRVGVAGPKWVWLVRVGMACCPNRAWSVRVGGAPGRCVKGEDEEDESG